MKEFVPIEKRPYRPCVGLMVFNDCGNVFSGQRFDNPSNAWQLPQGGIDENETPIEAAFRELVEETSIKSVDYISEFPTWLDYDVPEKLANNLWNGKYKGQTQKWILLHFYGNNTEIDIRTKEPEFNNWLWMNPLKLPENAIFFKRTIYNKINELFIPIIKDHIS